LKNPYELTKGEQVVDVRPWGDRAAESLADPINFAMAAFGLAVVAVMLPAFMPAWIILGLVIVISSGSVGRLLPFRYPPSAKDPSNKNKPGSGILFLGNMEFDPKKENRLPLENPADKFKEIWLSDDDLRKHFLILGSTGSGKSELLKAIFFNALCWGSGFFVADGKADNKLPLDNYAMARWFGRDDDLLTLNFLLAGRTPQQIRQSRRRRTNKTNPFFTSDSDTIIQMGTNLLPKVDGDAKNWQEKALNLWRGLVPALCWLRDNEAWEISVRHFVDYMSMAKLEWLYCKGYDMAARKGGVWDESFEGLRNYLEVGLPGFKIDITLKKFHNKEGFTYSLPDAAAAPAPPGRPGQSSADQSSQVYEQHGYRTTQLNPALNLLDKTYGHIFTDKFSEVDMVDVTLNNRILAMLIPSLERSAQEAEALGKLMVAVLKVMMGKNLGAEIEGSRREIMEAKATEANYPYIVALDELGYYFADGLAVMFAQARSLGFSMFAAAQDIEKLTEGSRAAEAGAMLANQVTKVFMRIDDANKTNEMIQKYLDKVTVALRKSYEWRDTTGFKRIPEVSIEDVAPATLRNLQSLKPGRGIINSMGLTLKVKSLYVGDFLQKHKREWFHINRFLQVRSLSSAEVEAQSVPMDALNDPYVRGYRLVQILAGEKPQPDVLDLIEGKPYEADFKRAQAMMQALSKVSAQIDPSIQGADRAIRLFEAAKAYLVGVGQLGGGSAQAKGTSSSGGPADQDQRTASIRRNLDGHLQDPMQDARGRLIQDGAGSGDMAAPLLGAHNDPFSFLNAECPLQRRPKADILQAPDDPEQVSRVVRSNSGSLQAVKNQLREDEEIDLLETQRTVCPPAVRAAIASALDASISFDPRTKRQQVELASERQQLELASAQARQRAEIGSENGLGGAKSSGVDGQEPGDANSWVAQALIMANQRARTASETMVGVTDETRTGLQRLEKAMGNPQPVPAAAAIERIVAEQATPATPPADEVDMSDIARLMEEIERASRS